MKKIINVARVSSLAKKLKLSDKTIVLAGGCFDILHIGHIAFLEKAKKAGDILVLLLESDQAIKLLKGQGRPVNNQENRTKILAVIEFVDFVIPLSKLYQAGDYNSLVKKISPDIIAVTAGDPNLSVKQSQAKEVGGTVKIVLKKIPEHSTTKLLGYF